MVAETSPKAEPVGSQSIRRLLVAVVAVRDLDAAIKSYQKLGFEIETHNDRPEWGLVAATFALGGGRIELIAPADTTKPVGATVQRFLDKRGEGFYMLTVEVDDVHKHFERLQEAGVAMMGEPHEAPPEGGWPCDLLWIRPQSTHGLFLEFLSFHSPKG